MVYIKFGPPDEKEEHPEENGARPYEKWRYRYIEGVGSDVILEFVDRTGDGDYRITWDPNQKLALQFPSAGLTLHEQALQVHVPPPTYEFRGKTFYLMQVGDNVFDRMRTLIRPRPTQ
jgi:hypothetical protein